MESASARVTVCLWLAAAAIWAGGSNRLLARDFRVNMIPNGNVFSCANCHVSPSGGGSRNAFGRAVEQLVGGSGAAIPFWSAELAARDSDGDGSTNGLELGDPDGDGEPLSEARVTNPGLAASRPANVAPTVQIIRPANGTVFTSTDTIQVEATATDSDGTITRVEFFDNGASVFTATAAPFVYTVAAVNLTAGTHIFTAKATDNSGAATTSAAIEITVSAPVNAAPTVQLTRPANGDQFIQPASIELEAAAADSDGSIAKVEFIAGRSVMFEATTAPYKFSLSSAGLSTGTHTLTARATDNAGATTTSAPVQITVVAPELIQITSIRRIEGNVQLVWSGGIGPFILQQKLAVADAAWTERTTTSAREASIPIAGDAVFFRVTDKGAPPAAATAD